MAKKEKDKFKELNQYHFTIILEKLYYCCGDHDSCEDCPLNIDEDKCCLSIYKVIYNNLTTLLKGEKK